MNVAILRAHLLPPYEDTKYPNYSMVKVLYNLCHVKGGCAFNLQHTQLFEYKQLLVICIYTFKQANALDNPDYEVFTSLEKYKLLHSVYLI